LSELFVTVLCS
jgi:hypothetical protein